MFTIEKTHDAIKAKIAEVLPNYDHLAGLADDPDPTVRQGAHYLNEKFRGVLDALGWVLGLRPSPILGNLSLTGDALGDELDAVRWAVVDDKPVEGFHEQYVLGVYHALEWARVPPSGDRYVDDPADL
jgi:hypothetical protein